MKNVSDIIKSLQSSPKNQPAQVNLCEIGKATIAACKNPYSAGFAVVVISAIGNRYGVTGFKTRPNQSDLSEAIITATDYATTHGIA